MTARVIPLTVISGVFFTALNALDITDSVSDEMYEVSYDVFSPMVRRILLLDVSD